MYEEFARSEAFFGREAMQKLYSSKIVLFGVGGVGGWCAEALARSGVGRVDIFDGDTVSLSNINRQVVALHSTVGMPKAEVMAARMRDIFPQIDVRPFNIFIDEGNIGSIDFSSYDVVLDAIDTVTSKVIIIERSVRAGVPVISCMGTGNKLDISAFRAADISKTRVCPLAREVRTALKKRGIESGIQVVASREKPFSREKISETERITTKNGEQTEFVKIIPASTPFVASAAGIFMASYIIGKLGVENG